MISLTKSLKTYLDAEESLQYARRNRDASLQHLAKHIKITMRAKGLNQGVVSRRLPHWPPSRLGNVLHLAQTVPTERDWSDLLEAVTTPMTTEEKQQRKRKTR